MPLRYNHNLDEWEWVDDPPPPVGEPTTETGLGGTAGSGIGAEQSTGGLGVGTEQPTEWGGGKGGAEIGTEQPTEWGGGKGGADVGEPSVDELPDDWYQRHEDWKPARTEKSFMDWALQPAKIVLGSANAATKNIFGNLDYTDLLKLAQAKSLAGQGQLKLEDIERASNLKAAGGLRDETVLTPTPQAGGLNLHTLAALLNSHQISEQEAYNRARAGGFTGTFKDFLIEKDRIIHQSGWNRGWGDVYDNMTGRNIPGGGSGGGGNVPPVGTPTPVGLPGLTPFGEDRNVLIFNDLDMAHLPANMRAYADTLLRQLGYVPSANLGTYGLREYRRNQNLTNAPTFEEALNLAAITDPRAIEWLRWFYYQKGLNPTPAVNPAGL